MSEGWTPAPGEVLWLFMESTAGNEQAGHRPALVVSSAAYNRTTGRVILIPITNKRRGWETEVLLPASAPVEGVIQTDQLRSMDFTARKARSAGFVDRKILETARDRILTLIERA